jgi:hypothetical protein
MLPSIQNINDKGPVSEHRADEWISICQFTFTLSCAMLQTITNYD